MPESVFQALVCLLIYRVAQKSQPLPNDKKSY